MSASLGSNTKMASSDPTFINCSGHNHPCILKTGTNPDSASFKKTFFLCSHIESCGFKRETLLDPSFCPAHPKEMVSQKTIRIQSGNKNVRYQCGIGRTAKSWCGVTRVPVSTVPTPTDFGDLVPKGPVANIVEGASLSDSFTSYRDARGSKAASLVVSSTMPIPTAFSDLVPKGPVAKTVEGASLSDSFTSYRDVRGSKAASPMSLDSKGDRDPPQAIKTYVVPKDATLFDLKAELEQNKKLLLTVNLACLPDKGQRLKVKVDELTAAISNFKLGEPPKEQEAHPKTKVSAAVPAATFTAHQIKQMFPVHTVHNPNLMGGRTAPVAPEGTAVIRDAIEKLHKALETKPTESEETADPDGLRVSLMRHQKQALTWLIWREAQHPSGGIFADDMGLGKTLTMIALVLKQTQAARQSLCSSDDPKERRVPPTLIVCPASMLHHWEAEVKSRCCTGTLTVYVYHGTNRSISARKLAGFGVIVTTYETVRGEVKSTREDDQPTNKKKSSASSSSLLGIDFARIVLDEGHIIKNAKTGVSESVCRLRATSRWVVTGTPIHNHLKDVYSFLRFMKFSPLDDLKMWKYWVDNGTYQGQTRLSTVIKSILLRRTKCQNGVDGKPLVNIPPKVIENVRLTLSEEERKIYSALMELSKKSLMSYLKSHGAAKAGKDKELGEKGGPTMISLLVMLLRLQQCCCHLSLLGELVDVDSLFRGDVEVDILADKLSGMALAGKKAGEENKSANPLATDAMGTLKLKVTEAYETSHKSTKISALMLSLEEIEKRSDPKFPTKSVVVSQWTSMLKIVALHLKKAKIRFCEISGNIPIKDRAAIVNEFNLCHEGPVVMLLSLKAGGVGLNLIGGSHLFLLDIHWNPALESQASDRIHRVGQVKDVHIHRFLCSDTVEERIDSLQQSKKILAKNILEGQSAKISRPTLQDLKHLFSV